MSYGTFTEDNISPNYIGDVFEINTSGIKKNIINNIKWCLYNTPELDMEEMLNSDLELMLSSTNIIVVVDQINNSNLDDVIKLLVVDKVYYMSANNLASFIGENTFVRITT